MTSAERSVPKPEFTDAEAGAKVFPDSTARRFNYYVPQKRKQTHYEDVTVEVQPDPRHYLSQGWLYGFADGRGGYPLDWTVLKAWGSDRPEPARGPGTGGKGYDPDRGAKVLRDLSARRPDWLVAAADAMAKAIEQDWQDFRSFNAE